MKDEQMGLRSANPSTLITVVVPTLNSAPTLDWTLASLASAGAVRTIVADSFSTDTTLEICRRWNVEVVSVPAGNMYQAINAGLRGAETEWVSYINSDDWVFADSYLRMVKMALQSDAHFVYGSTDFVDPGGRFLFCSRPASASIVVKLLRSGVMAFSQPSAIFRRSTFEELGGFDESYRAIADFDFFCRAARLDRKFLRFNRQPVAAFRLHRAQISAAHSDWDRQERAAMNERLSLRSGFGAKWAFFRWRMANIPWYAARGLRSCELNGRFTIQTSSCPPSDE